MMMSMLRGLADRIALWNPLGAPLAPAEGTETSAPHPAADVHRAIRAGLITILLIFGGFGTWAAVAPLSGAVIGHGVVKVDLNRKTVQHLEGGIVKEIRVRDGDRVQAGETLIVIEDESVFALVQVLQGQLDAETAKAARLAAERDGRESITFPEVLTARQSDPQVADLIRSETTYFDATRNALNEQIALLKKQIGDTREEIRSLEGRAQAEERAAALLAEEVEANESLENSRYVPRVHVLDLKRGIEDYKARRGEHLADMARARQKINDLELRAVAMRDDYVKGAAQQLTVSQARIYDLEERLRPSEGAKRRLNVLAPISGTVVGLQVFTVGGVIAPREPLMDIVPEDNPMIIETHISPDDIDDVHVGQEADVRLTAYKRRSTPLVSGTLSYVSADQLTEKDGVTSFFLVHVNVSRESLAEADDIELYPGMPAEVFIRTAERTAFDYLLAPITASLRRSFREP